MTTAQKFRCVCGYTDTLKGITKHHDRYPSGHGHEYAEVYE